MNIDKIVAMNSYRTSKKTVVETKKLMNRYQIDHVIYKIKVTKSTITVQSKYDSFQFSYKYKVRFMNVHEGVEKYCHERIMRRRSAYSMNPLNSQSHRNKLIELLKSEVRNV